jgi:hypothetical protein
MDDLDLAAAQLRLDARDLPALVEALATRLEEAMPGAVDVERRRAGLFSGRRHVARITCRLADDTYTLVQDRGAVTTQREKTVRGIRLKTEPLPVDRWLVELAEGVRGSAQTGEATYRALHDLLTS